MHESTVISKSGEIVERLSAVFALVNPVPAVCLDVSPQVVPTGVALAADVAGEWLLSRVDPHVTSEMGGSDEAMVADTAEERTLRLLLLVGGRGSGIGRGGGGCGILEYLLVPFDQIHKLDSRGFPSSVWGYSEGCYSGDRLRGSDGGQEVEVTPRRRRILLLWQPRGSRIRSMKHPAPSSSTSWGLPLRSMGWGMSWDVTDGEMILPSMAVEV